MRISTYALARIAVVLGILFAAGSQSAMAQGCTYKTLAFTGETAPGGGTFFNFLPPSIGQGGDVGFIGVNGTSEDSTYAVFLGKPGALSKLAATGDPVPDLEGDTFVDFSAVSVSKDGGLSFNAVVSGEGFSSGIWLASPAGVITSGNAVPIGFFIDEQGGASFRSGAMFAKGNLTLDGGQSFGSTFGALFNNASGSLADMLTVGTVLSGHRVQDIYNFDTEPDSVGSTVDSNESGAIALKVTIAPSSSPTPYPNEAIYAGEPKMLKLVAEQNDPSPGAGGTYNNLSPRPSIAANGGVAFSASLNSVSSGPSSGIFSGFPGAIVMRALEGAIVPTTTNVTFGTLSDAVINSTGDVIFRATIRYPNEGTRSGIWIKRQTGDPVLVAISGMTLPTPSGPREVTSVDFAGPGTFNDLHQFVFLARFGLDQGIYVADTRPAAPFVRVTKPRKPREFLTTGTSVNVFGTAQDETGVEKVEYTVTREVSASDRKAGGKPKKWVVSRIKRAKGDASFHFDVQLSMGLNLISIVATDKLGNVSEPYKIRMLRYEPIKK